MILDVLTELFDGNVGDGYENARLEEIYKEGLERYANKIPPGYKDSKKNCGNRHRFGDLIIWFQIMEKAESADKDIIFVTDDEKEDWWELFEGFKTGPCRALIKEFRSVVGEHIIWFYTTERFLTEAKHRVGISIKPKTIEETKRTVIIDNSKFWSLDSEPGQVSIETILGTQPYSSVAESDLASIGATSVLGSMPYKRHLFNPRYAADGSVMKTLSQMGSIGNSYFDNSSLPIDSINTSIQKELGSSTDQQPTEEKEEEVNSSDNTKTE